MKLSIKPHCSLGIGFLFAMTVLNSSTAYGAVTSYAVNAVIYEPAAAYNTFFNGSFEWDGTTVSNLHGTMNSSMYDINDVNPDYKNSFPLMHLNYQLAQGVTGNIVTASVFLENTTDVFSGGGYETGGEVFYGYRDGNIRNYNAYFTFVFDKTTMQGIADEMVYGDCTKGGMMGPACMTGHRFVGTMGAVPGTISISEVASVPIPAAVWLFGSAIAGVVGFQRRRPLFEK